MCMVIAVIITGMKVSVSMVMTVSPSTEQEDAGDIDRQCQERNRNSLIETDRNRPYEARYRLITDEERNHGQHNRAGKSRQIAQLAGPKAESLIARMTAGVAIRQGREQKGAGMR